tara:strand:- start:1161 stop:4223 length:3063 start_codon:yes stop_codon:yes gene_type:complete
MEKKKVRIYKAPDGKGKYLNKTAKFLQKAQQGAEVQSEESQLQPYYEYVFEQLSHDVPADSVYMTLLKSNIDENTANAIIQTVINKMADAGLYNPDSKQDEEEENTDTIQPSAQPQGNQAEEQQRASSDAEQEEMALSDEGYEDTTEEDYLNDDSHLEDTEEMQQDQMSYGDGGETTLSQYDDQNAEAEAITPFDEIIAKTPGIQESVQFAGIENYLPDYKSVSWDNIDALQPSQQAKYGGMPNKKQFFKNVMSLVKKEEGGEENNNTKFLGKGKRNDTLTLDVEKKKNNFVSTLKNRATEGATEELYKKVQKSGDPDLMSIFNNSQGQDEEQPMEQPMAQRGMITGDTEAALMEAMQERGTKVPEWYSGYTNSMLPQHYKRYYNMMKKLIPRGIDISRANMATGMYNKNMSGPVSGNPYYSYPGMAYLLSQQSRGPSGVLPGLGGPSIHVEDTDWLGRPKKYWIDYNGRRSSELQADEATMKNNEGEMVPFDIRDAEDAPIPYEYKGADYPTEVPPNDMQQYAQMGGYTGGENPLTRFTGGGFEDAPYYEADFLPEAQFGGTNMFNTVQYINDLVKNSKTKDDKKSTAEKKYDEEVRRATIKYVPRYRSAAPGFWNAVLPWNPIAGYAGSWSKQMTMPYYLGSKDPYTGSLNGMKPAARYVTKTGWLNRQPKKWIDIYDVSGSGKKLSEEDAKRLIELQKNKSKGKPSTNKRSSKKEEAEDNYQPNETKFVDGMDIKKGQYLKTNTDEDGNNYYIDHKGTIIYEKPERESKKRNPKPGTYPKFNPMINLQTGGYITDSYVPRFGPGGEFDPSTGFAMGMGVNTPGKSSTQMLQETTKSLMSGTTGSYADKLGSPYMATTLGTGASGVENIKEEEEEVDPEYVAVENKRKDMRSIDPEAGVNVLNAGVKTGLGFLDRWRTGRKQKRQIEDNSNADANYATSTTKDRGDWVDYGSQVGQFRQPEMGQDRSSRATYGQRGGYMQEGGYTEDYYTNPFYEEDEEVDMTEEELEQFLAAGGEIY